MSLSAPVPKNRQTTSRCQVIVGPCDREQTDHLLAPLLRCDDPGSATILHCDVLIGPCIKEQTQDHLLAPLLRFDERGSGTTLHCDVPVGPCVREQTDYLEVSTLRCDEQGGATILHCDVLAGPCSLKQVDTSRWSVHSRVRRARGWHHPDLRCPCRPLLQESRQTTSRCPL